MIHQDYLDEASRLLSNHRSDNSQAFCEGRHYALAWCLAGKPKPTPDRNRSTACRYHSGTAEHEAWHSGWASGHAIAVHLQLVKVPGVIHEVLLPQGGSVLITQPELESYAWEIVDINGELLREEGGYQFIALALREALNIAVPTPPGE